MDVLKTGTFPNLVAESEKGGLNHVLGYAFVVDIAKDREVWRDVRIGDGVLGDSGDRAECEERMLGSTDNCGTSVFGSFSPGDAKRDSFG
jgi:hypothetical protein